MFAKLIKYEWKSTGRLICLLNGYMILITIIGSIVVTLFPLSSGTPNNILNLLYPILSTIYFLSFFAVAIGVMLYLCIHMYQSTYKDEAYLTHTLPVSCDQLILSKVLYYFLVMLITSIIMALSCFLLFFKSSLSLQMCYAGLNEVCSVFQVSIPGMIIFTVTYILLSLLFSILSILAAMAIGQGFSNHRISGSILSYGAIYMINQIISFIFLICNGFLTIATQDNVPSFFFHRIFLFSLIFTGTESILFYLIIRFRIEKKLNLE